MLEAATNSRWDDLVELEIKRAALLADLASSEISGLRDAERAHLASLISQILECDQQIKGLTEEWMVELTSILQSLGAEKKLGQAYDPR